MQFNIRQSDLINPLVNLLRNTSNVNNELKSIQIEAISSDRIRLISSNGVNTLEYTLPALDVAGDTVMVNAKDFTEIVNRLRGLIKFDNGSIKCDNKKVKIGIMDQSYLTSENTMPENVKQFDFNDLKSVIKNRVFACGEQSSAVLNSLCVNNNEIAATNGNILSIGTLSTETGFENLLISQNLAKEIIQCFEGEIVNIGTVESKIVIYDDTLKLTGASVSGTYPKYSQLIPNNYHKRVMLEKNILIDNLDLMSVIADTKSPIVKLTFDKGILRLQSEYSGSEGVSELEVDYTFEPMTIAFNINYLIGVLKNTNDDVVELQLGDTNLSPAIIKGHNELSLLMPVQIK
jgi:DNA polymerase III sliding clamp (beta) subunit (PCNA family)